MTFSLPLVGVGILQAVVYLLFIRAVDLYERESLLYVIPVFVWGFTVAVAVAFVFNTLAEITLSTVASRQTVNFVTAVFVAPPVEECSKGLALFLAFGVSYLASRKRGAIEFSGVMDGIVYGAAVGFGFSIAEDLLYYAQFGPETFVVRRIFGGFGHAAFTSLTGVGIGLIPWVRSYFLKFSLPLLGLAGAITLHATFNFLGSVIGPLAYLFMFAVLLLYAILIGVWLAVERRTIREELREEASAGIISRQEYEILPTYFRRTGHYLRLIFTGRFGTERRTRKIHAAAVDLAFSKRLARSSHSHSQEARLQELRSRIQRLRGGAPAAGRAL